MPITEAWLPITSWEGLYEVSSHGRVRSLDRDVTVSGSWYRSSQVRRLKGRILRPSFDTFGYPMVKMKNGDRVELHRVHSLVAAAFIGPRPNGATVAHNDGNPKNAWLTNLRYDTMAGNFADKHRHGTYTKGQSHSRAALTQDQVEEIRLAKGTQRVIAAKYGISQQHVSNLQRGKRWID